ncbi:hypothetical protein LTR74_010969 [Friedmanniomyces endolithicus]|nr:hypothetical protein LTR74_010969 [Friedmanniomyces endolithicus]
MPNLPFRSKKEEGFSGGRARDVQRNSLLAEGPPMRSSCSFISTWLTSAQNSNVAPHSKMRSGNHSLPATTSTTGLHERTGVILGRAARIRAIRMSSSSTEREMPSSSAGIEKPWHRRPGPQVLWPGSRVPKLDPRVPIHSLHELIPSVRDLALARDPLDMDRVLRRRFSSTVTPFRSRRWVPSSLYIHVGVRASREKVKLGVASPVPRRVQDPLVNHRGCDPAMTPRILATSSLR